MVEDGSLALLVRCLGSSNVDLYRTMGSRFNRRKGHLHLCQEADCQSFAEGEVHLTSLVLRPGSNYSAGFLTAHGKRLLRDVATAEAEAGEEAEQDGPSAPEEETLGERERFLKAGKGVGGAGEGVRGGETPPVPPRPGRKRGVSQQGSGKGHAARLSHISNRHSAQQDSKKTLEKDAVRNLKERLSVLKKRAQEGPRASGEETPRRVTFLDPTDEESGGGEQPGPSSSVPVPGRIGTGTDMEVKPGDWMGLAGDMSLVSRNKDSDRLGPSGATSRSLKRSDARTAEGQLTSRALLSMSSGPTRSRKKKKKKGKDTLKKLKEVLTGKKDKDRKKRKRRRQSADGDPDDGGGSSGEESESSTSSETSRCSEESSKLMAPLKRLSSRQPGAVLQKLVEQVEQQMREFCEPTEVEAALTSGVRLVSYFNLLLKNQHSGNSREVRELYHLSHLIDQLRMGCLGRVGDLAASRFMAVHQSLADGNWNTARWLELVTVDQQGSAPAEMLLAARQYGRTMEKAKGHDKGKVQWVPSTGRGNGSWGSSSAREEGGGVWQSEKGKKGKKGKGKTKDKKESWVNFSSKGEKGKEGGKE